MRRLLAYPKVTQGQNPTTHTPGHGIYGNVHGTYRTTRPHLKRPRPMHIFRGFNISSSRLVTVTLCSRALGGHACLAAGGMLTRRTCPVGPWTYCIHTRMQKIPYPLDRFSKLAYSTTKRVPESNDDHFSASSRRDGSNAFRHFFRHSHFGCIGGL